MILRTAAFLLWMGTTFCTAETFDIISHPAAPHGIDAVVRIDRPNPQKPSVDYSQITFQPGDTVTIHAGGCVQSGGHGNTWHRYVNPGGGDADRLYHGLITIPFATGVLERIQRYWNKSVHIADNAPAAKLHLQLGFEDERDAYGDNGYYSHDDGPDGQCRGADGGPAWVELQIVHHGANTNPVSTLSWDLVVKDYDDNGIPLNPDWQSNVANKKFPDAATYRWPWQSGGSVSCTTGITNTDFDSSYGFSMFNPLSLARCASCSLCQSRSANFGYGGHPNWMPVTQTGNVFWEEKSAPGLDDEYSVNLNTINAAGATAGRKDGVHVEFDSDETIDILTDQLQLPWWSQFRSAVDGSDEQAHNFLDGKFMIVTGLMGLDFAHAPASGENHPAWSMAIHANEDFADDTWAFYVRNWGNEGYCSEDQHYVDYLDNQYTFRFPWPAGATSGVVKNSIVSVLVVSGVNAERSEITFIPNQAVLLTIFNLPDPSKHAIIGGELHLKWDGVPAITRRKPITRPAPTPAEASEALMSAAVRNMSAQQRAIYQASRPKIAKVAGSISKVSVQTVPPSGVKRIAANRHPTIRAVRDDARVARQNAEYEAVRKAYGGTFPVK